MNSSTGWQLKTDTQFDFLPSPWPEITIGLLGIVPLVLLVWLYLYEIRLVQSWAAVGLLGLRLVVLGLLWFIVCWQPTLIRPRVKGHKHQVIVVVDYSDSMNVTDPQRTPLEKLLLAKVLQIQPEHSQQIEQLIATCRANNGQLPADWLKMDERKLPEAKQEGPKSERERLYEKICQETDKLTRAEVIRRMLLSSSSPVLDQLRDEHDVHLLGFHRNAWEMEHPEETPQKAGAKILATNLNPPLSKALEISETAKGKKTVILFTDGKQTVPSAPNPVDVALRLGGRKIPVMAVAIGANRPPLDLAVMSIRQRSTVFKNMEAEIHAVVRVNNVPAQNLVVELFRDGNLLDDTFKRTIAHNGEDQSYPVFFRWTAEKEGTELLEVKIRPEKGKLDEINQENNSRSMPLVIAKENAKVLLVDSEMRWELHYLNSALVRDVAIRPEAVIFVQPRIGQVKESELEKTGQPRTVFPKWEKSKSPEDPLLDYDCIILGDVQPEQLALTERKRLARYVQDCGRTLVMLAGKRSMPMKFLKEQKKNGPDPLMALLPIEDPYPIQQKNVKEPHLTREFHLTHTAKGASASFLQLHKEPIISAERWGKLRGHYWGLIGKRKEKKAESLAFVEEDQLEPKRDPKKLSNESEDIRNALIVRQEIGFGQVLFIGLDSTWRWRYLKGDEYHHTFWSNIVRWAVADKLDAAGDRFVRFVSEKTWYKKNESGKILVRLQEDLPKLPEKAKLEAELWPKDRPDKTTPTKTIKLEPTDGETNQWSGEWKDLGTGEYRISLKIPGWNPKKATKEEIEKEPKRDTFLVQSEKADELAELAVDRETLEQIAEASGGEVIGIEDLAEKIRNLSGQLHQEKKEEKLLAWRDQPLTWILLAAVVFLLSAEWVGRKLGGLP